MSPCVNVSTWQVKRGAGERLDAVSWHCARVGRHVREDGTWGSILLWRYSSRGSILHPRPHYRDWHWGGGWVAWQCNARSLNHHAASCDGGRLWRHCNTSDVRKWITTYRLNTFLNTLIKHMDERLSKSDQDFMQPSCTYLAKRGQALGPCLVKTDL